MTEDRTGHMTAFELNPMSQSRVFHACQLLNSSVVLVSGGLAHKAANSSEVLPDELYKITSSGEVIKILEQSLGRFQHAMIKIEDSVWALGGKDSSNNAPSNIAEFNTTTNAWKELGRELHSKDTSELVVTQFPLSSLDCVPECQCGVANKEERIYPENEAEVRNTLGICLQIFRIQAHSHPWIAALVRDGDIKDGYINSKCGAVLVHHHS